MISPLLTDLYQLTMAYGYFKLGIHERQAVFHQIFRHDPFKDSYTIACGLDRVIDFLKEWHFSEEDLLFLSELKAPNEMALFTDDFLHYLKNLRFTCDVDAIPEGHIVFPQLPLIRIKGPLIQAQLLESTLLNIINFQTLIATKASRVCLAANGEPVLEFGLRRAQGPDGALSASRAAFIGGCAATSNVLAGKLYQIPVSGTHAHSWVTVFQDEITAFRSYAKVMPHNCVLLVDTYNTIEGIKHAIQVGKELREAGSLLRGIRLDSGDLAALSIKARALLDAAGFEETKIIASNNLDEYVIEDLKAKGATISIWGVGTHLATSYDCPALDGVYKLCALTDANGDWQYKLKLSEQAIKISNPGVLQARRFYKQGQPLMDMIFNEGFDLNSSPETLSLTLPIEKKRMEDYDDYVDLLRPIFRQGKLVYEDTLQAMRARREKDLAVFKQKSLYPVSLEKQLYDLKQKLIVDVKPL